MSQVIWKKTIEIEDYQSIEMPIDSEILCVQVQGDKPQIWFMCQDDEIETESIALRTIGTGCNFREHVGDYLGTFQMYNGGVVFHVFWEKIL